MLHEADSTTPSASVLANIGCNKAYDNANQSWKDNALEAVKRLATARVTLTVDDVHKALGENHKTHNASALGGVMREAARSGYIERTGVFEKSTRPSTHGRPVSIWRSKLNTGGAQ